MGLLRECKGYIAEWMSNGGWRETFSLDDKDTGDIETALTALCVFALGESLVPTQRREIVERIPSIRNHDGGWGWSKGYPSDTDHTALALLALSQLSRNEDLDVVDLRPSLDHAVRYLLSCQNEDGGFRQRRAGEAAPMIDTTAIAAYALATVGRPTDEPVRRASRFLLRNQNEDGGWGNYPGMASDLDSTFYAIQALIAVGESIISVQDAEECLAE
ncbi:MAG: prenyltransferase/squalene oxidase repeat-containing protein, partial [Candidatus Thorarchaeota archaeon]